MSVLVSQCGESVTIWAFAKRLVEDVEDEGLPAMSTGQPTSPQRGVDGTGWEIDGMAHLTSTSL